MAAVTDDPRWVAMPRAEWVAGAVALDVDAVAREAPLELRIAGVPIAVVMRTPGHDEELARGFLWSEGIAGPGQVASIRPCADVPPDAEGNVLQVVLADGVDVDLARLRRHTYASSSCGVCGKASLEAALGTAPPLAPAERVALDPRVLVTLPQRLGGAQEAFARTGGQHAAGLFTPDGTLLIVREDVGRHNAVDKVLGWAAARGLAPGGHTLVVSGRVSFEIVQKALAARIPTIVAVSAPTSLAIELARAGGIALCGFVRGTRMCLYAGAERLGEGA